MVSSCTQGQNSECGIGSRLHGQLQGHSLRRLQVQCSHDCPTYHPFVDLLLEFFECSSTGDCEQVVNENEHAQHKLCQCEMWVDVVGEVAQGLLGECAI